ncbi:Abi-alpha family protein [Undibacterium sp. TC4M20W]|uniref:Abi-alpha family protein n=1 Tax=Undibacterium sp. TC4M20W TaxID=3413052 RepID=UPI003BF0BF50
MSDEKALISDLFGAKPVSEAVGHIMKSGFDGGKAFLSAICMPAAQEFGLLLQDKVKNFRANNAQKMLGKAQILYLQLPNPDSKHAPPRIVKAIVENGSWTDDDDIQSMWAGLLATSCTESGLDDENLIYVNMLAQLTSAQVRLLNYICENASTIMSNSGLLIAREKQVERDQLLKISGLNDIHILDFMVEGLRSLGLISVDSGMSLVMPDYNSLAPSIMALHLYVRSKGHAGTAISYFKPDVGKLPF